jgi:regulator of sigma E protease
MSNLTGFAYLSQNPLISIAALLFILMVVVFFHELGHFLVARWCGIRVNVFSIGFGPELYSFIDDKGTRWRFAALPFGGYVKFYGDLDTASVSGSDAGTMPDAVDYGQTFAGKAVWKRAFVVAAGPLANFILAIAIYTGLFYVRGREVIIPKIAIIVPGSVAERSGFLAGDIVLNVDGREISNFIDLQRIIQSNAAVALRFGIDRGGMQTEIIATPEAKEISTYFGKQFVGVMGVQASREPGSLRHEHYGLVHSSVLAMQNTWQMLEMTGTYFSRLFTGRESSDKISGLMRTAEVAGKMAHIGFGALLELVAVFSVSIGFMNLLPVPVLDGGHLVFFAFEFLRGRPISRKYQEFSFRLGIILILGLMIFANFNDIVHMRAG